MKIIIAGGTGFIGTQLTKECIRNNIDVVIISRNPQKALSLFNHQITAIDWLTLQEHASTYLQNCTAVINLAGKNIFTKRWTEKTKKHILESRIFCTSTIKNVCEEFHNDQPLLFLNGSAISAYQLNATLTSDNAVDEYSNLAHYPSNDFITDMTRQVENLTTTMKNAHVINLRIAPPLSPEGGLLKQLLGPSKLLGCPILGSGRQPFSWIHIKDLISSLLYIINNQSQFQDIFAINFLAPEVLAQKNFAATLSKQLNKKYSFTMPAPILKLLAGPIAQELMLKGVNCKPTILSEYGFEFRYPTLDKAMRSFTLIKS